MVPGTVKRRSDGSPSGRPWRGRGGTGQREESESASAPAPEPKTATKSTSVPRPSTATDGELLNLLIGGYDMISLAADMEGRGDDGVDWWERDPAILRQAGTA